MTRILWNSLIALFVSTMTCGAVWAQATAQISGAVQDQSGAVLPGVEVTATQTETGIARMTVTNETGHYVLPNLPLGPYKLEGALPGLTTITRQGGMFAREHPVKEISVSLGEYQYRIGRNRQGPLVAQRAKIVRGIVLKTEQIAVDQWIDDLSEALVQVAGQSTQARAALERFLL